jgi:hypothetical protein
VLRDAIVACGRSIGLDASGAVSVGAEHLLNE